MRLNYFAFLLLFCLTKLAHSQPGSPDLTFNPGDYGLNSGIGPDGSVLCIEKTSNNQYIIGGGFNYYNSVQVGRIARIDEHGLMQGGFLTGLNFNATVKKLAIQADGKIIVSGSFTTYNAVPRAGLCRLNEDGTLDNSFNPGTGVNADIETIAIQDDGKILIGGNFTSFNGESCSRIARLNDDGSLDDTFPSATGVNGYVGDIEIVDENSFLVAGDFTQFDGQTVNRIIRVNTDGTLDAAFSSNLGTGPNAVVYTAHVTADNDILIGGNFLTLNGLSNIRIARLTADGTPDLDFNSGTGCDDIVHAIETDNSGNIFAFGHFESYDGDAIFSVVKILPSGERDITFNVPIGPTSSNNVSGGILSYNNNPIAHGYFTTYNNEPFEYIVQLGQTGAIDLSFANATGFNSGQVYKLKQLPDGRIAVAGYFNNYNGETMYGLVIINPDGSRDLTFNIGTGILPITGFVKAIEVMPAGDLLVGGNFTSIDGISITNFARISSDGIVDNTINPNPNGGINAILIDSNNDILVGGNFTTIDGQSEAYLAKMNQFGVLYNFWNGNGNPNSYVTAMAWMLDGTILLGGEFTTYGGTTRNRIAHIATNGNLLTDFAGTGFIANINDILVQPDGKVVVGGNCVSYQGTNVNNPVRLTSDGLLDSGFNVGLGAEGTIPTVHSMCFDGSKIIAVGEFTTYNGIAANRVVRINPDGSHDASFNTTIGANNAVTASAKLQDGRILIGGLFTEYDEIGRNRIAALNACVSSSSNLTAVECDSYTINNETFTESGLYTQVIPNALGCDSIITLDLTIYASYFETTEASSCGTYMWNDTPYASSGIYTQQFATANGCDSILTLDLTVYNLNMTVNQTGNTLTSAESGAQYQWIDCDNGSVEIPGATNQSFTPTSNGSYAVVVTENGCSDVSNCVDITTIDIALFDSSPSLLLYPNPFEIQLTIVLGDGAGWLQVQFYNSLGELVHHAHMRNGESFDASHLAHGVYSLRVEGENGTVIRTCVK